MAKKRIKEDNTRAKTLHINNKIIEGVTRNQIDFSEGIIEDNDESNYAYGGYNDYPNYAANVVFRSKIGGRCLDVLNDFVQGRGISNEQLQKSFVNKDQSFNEFHRSAVKQLTYIRRLAVLVKYDIPNIENLLANPETLEQRLRQFLENPVISSVRVLPSRNVRYCIPNEETGEVSHIIYNPYLNTSEERLRKQWRKYPLFNPNNLVKDLLWFASMKEHDARLYNYDFAQVLFYNEPNEINEVYSRPNYFVGGENDLLIDKGISEFHEANIRNNFFMGGILAMQGEGDQPLEDVHSKGDYRTQSEEVDSQLTALFSGSENTGKIMRLFFKDVENIDKAIKFVSFEGNNNDKKLMDIANYVIKSIPLAMGVEPLLLGVYTAGSLGSTKEKEEAILFQNNSTEAMRQTLESIYNRIFSNFRDLELSEPIEILEKKDYLVIPEKIYEFLDIQEVRKYAAKKFDELELETEEGQEIGLFISSMPSKLKAQSFNDYPQAVKNNAKKGIELNEAIGNKCATQVGKVRAQQLAQGEAITVETITRMYSYLSRAEAEYRKFKDDPKACANISYLLWGGLAAKAWAESKLRELDLLDIISNKI